ncbi:MAG: ABC transporter ATP-binding protein [Deltaproteobacteria bacterium]|jgi:NitT/TauT family transport system ATP-binding protein|nr:ABC transporter ATP-binding protein [Deltaproteobacteria bacterium]
MTPAALEIVNLSKAFPGPAGGPSVQALDGVSLRVEQGEYVSILGASGCGKSTLLTVAAGLLAPDSGLVRCGGQAVRGTERGRQLMFQDDALFPWLNVLGNVRYGLRFVPGLSREQQRGQAMKVLEMVGLTEFSRFRVHQLSGGMRQRVALARVLAPEPQILLMDEPFSALDAMTRERLYADLQQIWQDTGKTIVMVTHNVREAVCLSTGVALMASSGRLLGVEKVSLPYPRRMNDVALAATADRIQRRLAEAV